MKILIEILLKEKPKSSKDLINLICKKNRSEYYDESDGTYSSGLAIEY